ncbi:MAG: hypothetical protein ACOY4M_08375 [Pseudomonadota bacterium]
MTKQLLRQSAAALKTQFFNIDNGAGVTVDEVVFKASARGAHLVRVYALYGEATGTVAAGNFRVGSTAGGAQYVAATAYENGKAVGDATEGVIINDVVPPNGTVFVRHTGVAATPTGTASIVIEYVDNQ